MSVGQVAAGMEIETQGFQLGVCLSKISIFWVSAFPHPDTVTQLRSFASSPLAGQSRPLLQEMEEQHSLAVPRGFSSVSVVFSCMPSTTRG